MRIAIEGCAHGDLEKIYAALQFMEKTKNIKIDLLICCGDFQATRNLQDLSCMAVPAKYRSMCSFYKYYSGEKRAPMLTLFIGGNHEASNHLQELAYGGWVAPNIYYLGYAGVVNIGGLRIAGLSGIYNSRNYMCGHFELAPYSEDTKRSVYHIRNLEVFRLKQLTETIDVMLSHDWPRGVVAYGNKEKLLQKKPFLRKDIETNALGSKPAEELLNDLKPTYWFAAHLHCKFPAIIPHGPRKDPTKFLSLDKCLPRRIFLQVLEFDRDESSPLELMYDLEWLTIIHLTNHLLSVKKGVTYMPGPSNHERWVFTPTEEEKNHVLKRFNGNLKVPLNFVQTVNPYYPNVRGYEWNRPPTAAQLNPQTTTFCKLLGVDDPLALILKGYSHGRTSSSTSVPSSPIPGPGGDPGVQASGSQTFDNTVRDKKSSVNRANYLFMKRLSMSLPPPKWVDSPKKSVGAHCLSVISEESSQSSIKQDSSQELPMETEDLSAESPSTRTDDTEYLVPAKKFKRRNQEFYASDD